MATYKNDTEISPAILILIAMAVVAIALVLFHQVKNAGDPDPLTDSRGVKRIEKDCLKWGVAYKDADGDEHWAPTGEDPINLDDARRLADDLEAYYIGPGVRYYYPKCVQWK
jgi:hypothetical protein